MTGAPPTEALAPTASATSRTQVAVRPPPTAAVLQAAHLEPAGFPTEETVRARPPPPFRIPRRTARTTATTERGRSTQAVGRTIPVRSYHAKKSRARNREQRYYRPNYRYPVIKTGVYVLREREGGDSRSVQQGTQILRGTELPERRMRAREREFVLQRAHVINFHQYKANTAQKDNKYM